MYTVYTRHLNTHTHTHILLFMQCISLAKYFLNQKLYFLAL